MSQRLGRGLELMLSETSPGIQWYHWYWVPLLDKRSSQWLIDVVQLHSFSGSDECNSLICTMYIYK